jgi:glycosyltransferase involved in cell wall biosynthesis
VRAGKVRRRAGSGGRDGSTMSSATVDTSAPTGDTRVPGRLGVYQDGPFMLVRTEDGDRVAPDPVDAPFFRFAVEVGGRFDRLVVFARVVEGAGDPRITLPPETGIVRLPDYGSLREIGMVVRGTLATVTALWRGLGRVDTVWAFAPHPFQFVLVALALLRGKRVAIGIRQDTRRYFRARLPSARWKPALLAVDAMELLNRLLARRLRTTVVGAENAARYAPGRAPTMAMTPVLVRAADVVDSPRERDWDSEIVLLTVGRVDAEKNPALLVDAFSELDRLRPGRYRLRWVGVGPLAEEVRRRTVELGIDARFELVGYVPFGNELLELYRTSHALVHVSLTEGVPQVLVEALASGTPVVATDVGGVRDGLDEGRAGLLVPPSDRDALVDAVLRLSDDEALRAELVDRGLALARGRTLEFEAARVARFLAG